jgi:hypothetical protein
MKHLISFAISLGFAACAVASEPISNFDWTDASHLPHGAVAATVDGRAALKIENTNDTGLRVVLLTVEKPKISKSMYAIEGEVRYDDVKGDGFLEMWNYFAPEKSGMPEGQYFSRTMGESGAMGKITGTSDWRPFSLPFNSTGANGAPTRLEINLILRGHGTVYLSPFKLVQYKNAKSSQAWWTPQAANMAGAIGGSVIGLMGALIGTLASFGKGRNLVLGLVKFQIGLGAALAVGFIVALAESQPYAVWYPLALGAIILLPTAIWMGPSIKRRYEERELRRMQSLDVL